jgi:hypothetical protein
MISGSTRYARQLGFFGGLGAKVEENVLEKITGINWIPDDTKGLRITTRPSAIIGATLGTILGAMASRRASRLTGAVIGFFAGAVAVSATGWAKSEGF